MGFRLAFVVVMRGTPWMTRGSFMKAGSSLAGTVDSIVSDLDCTSKSVNFRGRTPRDDRSVVAREATVRWRCSGRSPQVVGGVREEVST